MNELQVLENPEFGKIRIVMVNNTPWFVGRDVAEALGYSNPLKAIRDHVDEEDKTVNDLFTVNGTKGILINESGVYSLILSSKLPNAKRFKKWVTSEVLPTIRKTGSYTKALTPAEMLLKQAEMMVAQEKKMQILEQRQYALQEAGQEIDDRLNKIETSITMASGYCAAATFLRSIGVKSNSNMERWIGQKASKLCKLRGVAIGKIPVNGRIYSSVNSYPVDILEEVYQEYTLSHC